MPTLEERVQTLEKNKSYLVGALTTLGILGVGLGVYANYLQTKLSEVSAGIPQLHTEIDDKTEAALGSIEERTRTALNSISSEANTAISNIETTASTSVREATQKAQKVKKKELRKELGVQYPRHGKILATIEHNGRVTLSGLFGELPLPEEGNQPGDDKPVLIAKLPEGICPQEHQLFDVPVHPVGTARLDIEKNGEIKFNKVSKLTRDSWDETVRGKSFLSLDGVSFFSGSCS